MPLESATSIESLDEAWPLSGDPANRGDDHLRLIKNVLKITFPGEGGNGFSEPITATEEELNFLTGLTGNVQNQFSAMDTRLDNLEAALSAPAGTRLAFHQAAAPAGWTQVTDYTSNMLRVVSGVGGGAGGTADPIVAHKHTTGSHVLTLSQIPSHVHYALNGSTTNIGSGNYTSIYDNYNEFLKRNNSAPTSAQTSSVGSNEAHNHGDTGTSYVPKYVDMIICQKDV